MSNRIRKNLADLRMPHEWWEDARKMTRNFIFHNGPTNSGKTHSALEVLRNSKTGVYCGPLRLLAAEVYEKLTVLGVKCSLITGQELKIVPGATHLACTIEGLNFEKKYHCGVIDEIQMIGDVQRGSAWTNALFGLLAPEIHLTGEFRAKEIIKDLLSKTQDVYSEKNYRRMSMLSVCPPVNNMKDLRDGDCLVAFSRRKCYALKNHIEKEQPGSCAIIYGSLPPDVRKEQALRFNSRQHKYLIATDAVGMGLNYNINRVIFMESSKSSGRHKRKLLPSEIKQIAGRAGRNENDGEVTGCDLNILNDVCIGLSHYANQFITKAALSPNYLQIKEFSDSFYDNPEKVSYSNILKQFSRQAKLEQNFFLQSIEETCLIANCIQKFELSLEDMHRFCTASIRVTTPKIAKILKEFAKSYKNKCEVRFEHFENLDEFGIDNLENMYFLCEMYMSLSRKFKSEVFIDTLEVSRYLLEISIAIQEKLNCVVDVPGLNMITSIE